MLRNMIYCICTSFVQTVAKGMTPITKNMIVIDEYGNTIGLTYPKRAKGLIKKGRAVSVGENCIRLTGSPPSGTSIGGNTMSTRETLIAAINEMSEKQMHSLLVLLNSFNVGNTPEIQLPAEPVSAPQSDPRSDMLRTLQEQINVLAQDNYSSPNAVDVLKELKDMLNMLLRV